MRLKRRADRLHRVEKSRKLRYALQHVRRKGTTHYDSANASKAVDRASDLARPFHARALGVLLGHQDGFSVDVEGATSWPGWLAGWLAGGWLAGWLAAWLASGCHWLVGESTTGSITCTYGYIRILQ